jgi:hypothetical protein
VTAGQRAQVKVPGHAKAALDTDLPRQDLGTFRRTGQEWRIPCVYRVMPEPGYHVSVAGRRERGRVTLPDQFDATMAPGVRDTIDGDRATVAGLSLAPPSVFMCPSLVQSLPHQHDDDGGH